MLIAEKRFTKQQLVDLFELEVIFNETIQPGDLYIAQRSGSMSGAHLLTCDHIENGMIIPTTLAYPFDIHECVKVVEKQKKS